MNKKIILCLLFILISISVFGLKGSGTIISEERSLSNFHSVSLNCNAKVIISQTGEFKASIKADDNVMSSIKTEVKRGELQISVKGLVSEATIEIKLSMDKINTLNVGGPGSIKVNGELTLDNLELKITGQGNIILAANAKFIFSKIFGGGYIDIGGQTEMHEIELSGGGIIKALNFNAAKSKININGEGIAQINVIDNLEVKIGGLGGNGTIEYKGTPTLKIEVLGAANIKTLN